MRVFLSLNDQTHTYNNCKYDFIKLFKHFRVIGLTLKLIFCKLLQLQCSVKKFSVLPYLDNWALGSLIMESLHSRMFYHVKGNVI